MTRGFPLGGDSVENQEFGCRCSSLDALLEGCSHAVNFLFSWGRIPVVLMSCEGRRTGDLLRTCGQ